MIFAWILSYLTNKKCIVNLCKYEIFGDKNIDFLDSRNIFSCMKRKKRWKKMHQNTTKAAFLFPDFVASSLLELHDAVGNRTKLLTRSLAAVEYLIFFTNSNGVHEVIYGRESLAALARFPPRARRFTFQWSKNLRTETRRKPNSRSRAGAGCAHISVIITARSSHCFFLEIY